MGMSLYLLYTHQVFDPPETIARYIMVSLRSSVLCKWSLCFLLRILRTIYVSVGTPFTILG